MLDLCFRASAEREREGAESERGEREVGGGEGGREGERGREGKGGRERGREGGIEEER